MVRPGQGVRANVIVVIRSTVYTIIRNIKYVFTYGTKLKGTRYKSAVLWRLKMKIYTNGLCAGK